MAKIADFYPGTTKRFSLAITLNGAVPDLRADTVTLFLKRTASTPDAEAPLSAAADVATDGLDGVALWDLTPEETALVSGGYLAEIKWERASGEEYIVYHERLVVLERISDVVVV